MHKPTYDRFHGHGGSYMIRDGERELIERTKSHDSVADSQPAPSKINSQTESPPADKQGE